MFANKEEPHPRPSTASPQPIYSLSPNPSPNGEGSENHCLQMKGAFLRCKERLFST